MFIFVCSGEKKEEERELFLEFSLPVSRKCLYLFVQINGKLLMKKIVVFLFCIAACFPVTAAPTRLYAGVDTAAMNRWVESVMRTLSVP